MDSRLRAFLLPSITPGFVLRALSVAAATYIFFGLVCTPFLIRGKSMEPTYWDGGFNFIWKPKYWFSEPSRGDVVAVRLAGDRVVYLKRIVALAGDKVEFREGTLMVNGSPLDEPYVQGPCTWNLPEREVEGGQVYVVGDNRAMPMEGHDFGQTSSRRLVGGPLW
jgi:signal peptidase I